ncbi:hypothetical protein [Stappia sp.]|uniref:glucosamine inositolphosphorylceramide transferase family protein n=1 Tax=Stappia sp. TaxID=1870903 RepID=UPI0032D95651
MTATQPVTLVTAADAAFARTLAQFLLSVRRRALHRGTRVVVYDLGMRARQRADLERRFPFATVRDFSLDDYPPHVAVEAGTFAWKPLVIRDAAERNGGLLFWFDSATLFRGDLSEPLTVLETHGVYTLRGQASLAERCIVPVREHLGIDPDFLHRQIRVGGVIGFDLSRAPARDLLSRWADLALDPQAFRPACRAHNADQTVLTALLFEMEAAGELVLNDGDIDISSPAPVRWMTSRNKVRADRPLWQDPFVRLSYWAYKTADRLNLRWQRFYHGPVEGWHRWPKEHFQTFVMRAGDAAPTPIRAPASSYYADPFLWRYKERLWLFVEEFVYSDRLGRLVAMELDDRLRPGPVMPILPLRTHASYPFLFEEDGRLYMVPETCALGTLDLYVCEAFPDRWRRVRRLREGVDAVDTALFRQGGWWWLVTCEKPAGADGGRGLCVYRSRDLLDGAFEPLPVNAERQFADRDFGYGRGAGSVFADGEGLLRVMQKNETYYGEAVEVRRISGLERDSYSEVAVAEGHPLEHVARLVSPHHISMHGDAVAFDVRDRLGFVSGLPGLGRRWSAVNAATKRFLGGDPQVQDALARAVRRLCAELRPRDGRPPSSDPRDGG